MQSQEESFTRRREGAKRMEKLRHGRLVRMSTRPATSFPNLSVLAPLRETSAMQSQEESFTRRREGAKRMEKLRHGRLVRMSTRPATSFPKATAMGPLE